MLNGYYHIFQYWHKAKCEKKQRNPHFCPYRGEKEQLIISAGISDWSISIWWNVMTLRVTNGVMNHIVTSTSVFLALTATSTPFRDTNFPHHFLILHYCHNAKCENNAGNSRVCPFQEENVWQPVHAIFGISLTDDGPRRALAPNNMADTLPTK